MHQGLPSVSSRVADSSTGAGSVSSSTIGSVGSNVYEHVRAKSHMMQCMMQSTV
jgi:hypothetical protein